MLLTGGCYCGAIRYQALERVRDATICHCEICRRTSGAPCVAWFSVKRADFQLLKGRPTQFRSSVHTSRTFCAQCGAQLMFINDASPELIDVTIASLDEPDQLAPDDHTFTHSQLVWLKLADALPRYARSRTEDLQ